MKRILLICCLLVLLVGCNNIDSTSKKSTTEKIESPSTTASVDTASVVEIKEKMFIAQSNDIYLNPQDYLGKTIKYEGIFRPTYWEEDDTTYNYVIRYGPGCCGADGEAGFEVTWDKEWPKEGAWCEAIGTLESYEQDGFTNLRVSLRSLKVLAKRGSEFVTQ